jgi:hypothetical protein
MSARAVSQAHIKQALSVERESGMDPVSWLKPRYRYLFPSSVTHKYTQHTTSHFNGM